MLCGGGDFFQYCLKVKNKRAISFYRCFHNIVIIHLCLVRVWFLFGRGKQVYNIFFLIFSHSCVGAILSDLLVDKRSEFTGKSATQYNIFMEARGAFCCFYSLFKHISPPLYLLRFIYLRLNQNLLTAKIFFDNNLFVFLLP